MKMKPLALTLLLLIAAGILIAIQLGGLQEQLTGQASLGGGTAVNCCGNGTCDSGLSTPGNGSGLSANPPRDCAEENACTCPADCLAVCGDGCCTGSETGTTCPADCSDEEQPLPVCGNGTCDAGETLLSCPADCSVCGDGQCTGNETTATCIGDCPIGSDLPGGDTVPAEYCGDGTCSANEDAVTCANDCPPACGDGACTSGESAGICPIDCSSGCGNTLCEPNENSLMCPVDCGSLEEIITLNQNILNTTIIPQNPQQVQTLLQNMGFTNQSIESIQAGLENFTIHRSIDLQRIQKSTFTTPIFATAVTITIANNTNRTYSVQFLENIPKTFVKRYSSGSIQSPNEFAVIQEDPVLQFVINKLEPLQQKSVTYRILNQILSQQQAQSFPNPLISNYRMVSEQERVGCQQDNDCNPRICTFTRCIQSECYYLSSPPGTGCGPGQECNPNQECVEKTVTPYNAPQNLLNLPVLILTVAIILLAIWIIKEYASE